MPIHTVEQGEHLAGIAQKYGFSDYKTIWNDGQNADLKAQRKNPNVLFPGDQLFIPDRQTREESRPADAAHNFQLKTQKLQLRIKVVDLRDKPVEQTCFFKTGKGDVNLVSPSSQIYQIDIDPAEKSVTLSFPKTATEGARPDTQLEVGSLDPVDKLSGQQERLNNLGYFAGFSKTPDDDQFKWAVEEFQHDQHIKPTGVCDAGSTQPALQRKHGDKA